MTLQAQNSLALYKGGNPATIRKMLAMQKKSSVEELMEHFGTTDINELSLRLSMGG